MIMSLKKGGCKTDPLRNAMELSKLGLKRGQWIYAEYYGDMDAEGRKQEQEEKKRKDEKRAKSYSVRGDLQPTFPETWRMYVYKERQIGKMCGQHAVNALLQGPYVTEDDLESTAKRLESAYRKTIGGDMAPGYGGGKSPYRDTGGMYSIEVLKEAVKSYGYRLESLDKPSQLQVRQNPQLAEGFLLNKASHWFTIRQVHGNFWVLDSMRERPESLPKKHIRGVIQQLSHQGYSTFVINGSKSLPKPDPKRTHAKYWFDVERMLYDEKQPGAEKNRWLQIERDDDVDDGSRNRRRGGGARTIGGGGERSRGDRALRQLMNMGMGWNRKQCEDALKTANGDPNAAVNILLGGGGRRS